MKEYKNCKKFGELLGFSKWILSSLIWSQWLVLFCNIKCLSFQWRLSTGIIKRRRFLTFGYLYYCCIGASRGFAFVEFNAAEEATRWMEMKQVENKTTTKKEILSKLMRCFRSANHTPRGDSFNGHSLLVTQTTSKPLKGTLFEP